MNPGLKRTEKGQFGSDKSRITLAPNRLVALVNEYIQTFRTPQGKVKIGAIKKQLGWNDLQWAAFKEQYGGMLTWEVLPKFSVLETPETNDPDGVKAGLIQRGISPDEVERRIEVTHGKLKADLFSIGLSKQEVEAAIAMQNFGENRFANAMEMISSGVFATATKLQTRQKEVEERLKNVRKAIDSYGPIPSEERTGWVEEEESLTKQYVAIGKLLSEIQDTWYQGAAQLALVKMRMRSDDGRPLGGSTNSQTQRSNKPGFSPRVMNSEVEVSELKSAEATPEAAP